ncbi:SNF2-related protein [Pseudidiomarina salilacus]|uniref:SNF2-related protein n=1 Tax=Pseudidiomarina salilacus TaxID=3384452 RepID=UPI0039851D71
MTIESTEIPAVGQRWLSETELEQGLGLITQVEGRLLSVFFPATDELRQYALAQAPLARYRLLPDDQGQHADGWAFTVQQVEVRAGGVYVYHGEREDDGSAVVVPEAQLAAQVATHHPLTRLMAGKADRLDMYRLRQRAQVHLKRWQQSPVAGLLGARAQLLPHQLYIAHSVADRFQPRVLLADEVGLGKTIEAGLILQRRLLTGRAQRVLIAVPDALCHQWLVELRRRFALAFSLFDSERCAEAQIDSANVFETEQLVVIPQSLLDEANWFEQLLAAEFDTLIVDEAHRIAPATQRFSQLQQLCEAIASVLLLTATPEQAGLDGHFARLQLLDPDRFHSFAEFQQEQQDYQQLTKLATVLAREGAHKLLDRLLDHYGTGRLMFRNSRSHIGGFPERICLPVELEGSDDFAEKAQWLQQLLREHKQDKFVLICRSSLTVQELYDYLRVQHGVHAAVFHEGMTLLERDRAAEYFASPEDGCPILLCSEIGSEGRNFQFTHQLVLFDLPDHPDLLEQRIGRLDRLGQRQAVQIHVPYTIDSRDAYLFEWYSAMQAFSAPNPVGAMLYDEFHQQLQPFLTGDYHDELGFAELVAATEERAQQLRAQIEQGRDRLQELNAFRPQAAQAVIAAIHSAEQADELQDFMLEFWARFGVDYDELNAHSGWLRPTEQMRIQLPGLAEDGITVTFSRDYALDHEQVEFLSWDHPQVQHALEVLSQDSFGSTSVALMKNKALAAGTWFVELTFSSQLVTSSDLVAHEFYPHHAMRVLLDSQGRELTARVNAGAFDKQLQFIDKKQARALLQQLRPQIQQLITQAWQPAQQQQQQLLAQAQAKISAELGQQLQRLHELKQRNPAVRESEVEALQERQQRLLSALEQPQLQLDSARIIVNMPQ